jgi:hypothetical protein
MHRIEHGHLACAELVPETKVIIHRFRLLVRKRLIPQPCRPRMHVRLHVDRRPRRVWEHIYYVSR